MKQTVVPAVKKRGKSTLDAKLGTLGRTSLSREEAQGSEASFSDVSDDQKHYYKCQCCQNKNQDDYLRERRAARERKLRKCYESEYSVSSHDEGDLSRRSRKKSTPIGLPTKQPTLMITPKQSSNPSNSPRALPVQDFLIKVNSDIQTLEKIMRDRDYRITTSEEAKSGHLSSSQSPLAPSELTPRSNAVTEFSPKVHVTNELFSIKEVDQSASFGQNSQVDPKHLNFQNSGKKINTHGTSMCKNTMPTAGPTTPPKRVPANGFGKLKVTLMFKGKLRDRTWVGKGEYLPVLQRIRQLFI